MTSTTRGIHELFPNDMANSVINNILHTTSIGNGEHNYEVTPRTVRSFLMEGIRRKIPPYQRPYSWSKTNVESLLEDIYRTSKIEENASWYLGTIYSTKYSMTSLESHLLDGQQRVTTLILILKEISWFDVICDQALDLTQLDAEVVKEWKKQSKNAMQCIYNTDEDDVDIMRFETEPIANKILKRYILESPNIDTFEAASLFIKKFDEEITSEMYQYSASTRALKENISTIRKFLKDHFYSQGQNRERSIQEIEIGFRGISKFTKTLLYKLWLIEVPLRNEGYSLQIFEGINNRGKELSLADKLQFRSLIRVEAADAEYDIKMKWKDLFVSIENLNSSGQNNNFKSQEDFYKIFFLAHKGAESTSDQIVDLFQEKYLDSAESLLRFFNVAADVVSFFKDVQKPYSENSFSIGFADSNQVEKSIALLGVLRRLLIASSSSRVLIVDLIISVSNQDDNGRRNLMTQGIWNIIQLGVVLDVFNNQKTNTIRGYYNIIIRHRNNINFNRTSSDNRVAIQYPKLIHQILNNEEDLFKIDGLTLKNGKRQPYQFSSLFSPGVGLIKSKSNDVAKLIIYITTYLTEYRTLSKFSLINTQREELEHIFPRKWETHWSEKTYTMDEVIDYLESLPERDSSLNIPRLISMLKVADDFELRNLGKRDSQENSVIEWYGNKIILSNLENQKLSNKAYSDKKRLYLTSSAWVRIPEFETEIGVGGEDDWTYKEIILRSLNICDLLCNKLFDTSWDSV